jgi:hypothetical protein
MKNVLVAILKLAMDAGYSDKDIVADLRTAAHFIENGKFFSYSKGVKA